MSIDSTGAVPPSAPAPQSNPASVPPVGAPPAFATAAAQPAAAPAEAVHFLDYWQILYSRKEIVIAVAILLILVGIVITRQMPKVFAATTIIEVQRETPNIDLVGHGMPRYDPIYLRTQFEIRERKTGKPKQVKISQYVKEILGKIILIWQRINNSVGSIFNHFYILIKIYVCLPFRNPHILLYILAMMPPSDRVSVCIPICR